MKLKTIIRALVILAALQTVMAGCSKNSGSEDLLTEGMTAPEFEAKDHTGKTVTLSSIRAKGPVVLTFLRSFF